MYCIKCGKERQGTHCPHCGFSHSPTLLSLKIPRKFEIWLLIIILCIASYVRLAHPELTIYLWETELSIDVAKDIVVDHHFPLVLEGLTISSGGNYGPFLAYFFSFFYIISSTITFLLLIAPFLNIVALFFLYLLLKRYFHNFIALTTLALFAVSPPAVFLSRGFAPVNFMPSFPVLFFIFLFLFLYGSQRWIIFLSISLASMLQDHPSFLVFVPLYVFVLIVKFREIKKSYLIISFLLMFILFSPLLYYDITHQFSNTKALLQGGESRTNFQFNPMLFQYPFYLISNPSQGVFNSIEAFFFGIGIIVLIMLLYQTISLRVSQKEHAIDLKWIIFGAWLLLPLLFWAILGKTLVPHYFTSTYPVSYILIAFGLSGFSFFCISHIPEQHQRMGRIAIHLFAGFIVLGIMVTQLAYFHSFLQEEHPMVFTNHDVVHDEWAFYKYKIEILNYLLNATHRNSYIIKNNMFCPGEYPVWLWDCEYQGFIYPLMEMNKTTPLRYDKTDEGYIIYHTTQNSFPKENLVKEIGKNKHLKIYYVQNFTVFKQQGYRMN